MTTKTTMTNSTINTTPCTLNSDTFYGQTAFQYILNRNFFDSQRSKPTEGFYVVDRSKFGTMSMEQEYAYYRFIREEFAEEIEFSDLEELQSCYGLTDEEANILYKISDFEYETFENLAIYFLVDGDDLDIGLYDLKREAKVRGISFLWGIDEVDDLDFGCFKCFGVAA